MRLLFTDESLQDDHASLMHNLTKKPEAAEATVRPNSLPTPEEARLIFDR